MSFWRKLAVTAIAVAVPMTATAASTPASAATPQVSAHIRAEMTAQLKHLPGGTVIAPNKIQYRTRNITLTYIDHKPGRHLSAQTLADCQSGWVCMWTDTWFYGAVLKTESEWCPPKGGKYLNLDHFPTWKHNIRSVDSENSYHVTGYWRNFIWSGTQWTLEPHGYDAIVSPDNIQWIQTCP